MHYSAACGKGSSCASNVTEGGVRVIANHDSKA